MTQFSKLFFFVSDLLLLNLSIWAAFYFGAEEERFVNQVYLLIYSDLAWIFLVLVAHPYSVTKNWTIEGVAKHQLVFLIVHSLVLAGLILFLRKSYTPAQILLMYLIFIPAFVLVRVLALYARRITTGEVIRHFLIVGQGEAAHKLRKHFLLHPEEKLRFAGSLALAPDFISEVASFCEKYEIHQIFCCSSDATPQQLKELVDFGLNSMISVKIVIDSSKPNASDRILLDSREGNIPTELSALALDEPVNQLIKRVFDVVFTIVFFVLVLSWLLPIMAILIKIDSPGPIFYLQKRNGRNNRPFDCIKFRTMVYEKDAEFKQATRGDQRITRLGKFLRKSSIDEFPQFINVLLGEMSLIGPRPHPIRLNEQFAPLIQNLMARHYAKPGITGLAQCMGYRGETKDLADMENRVRLDRYYIENWSFWFDLKIVVLTVVSLVRGSEKAY